MDKYYVNNNTQVNGNHEVHKEEYDCLLDISNRTCLGYFDYCKEAAEEAKSHYSQVNGCIHYSRCHTS